VSQYPPKDLNKGKVDRYSYKEGIMPGEPEVIIISSNHVIRYIISKEMVFCFPNCSDLLFSTIPGGFSNSLGTIQVLRHQGGGWVGSENGNF
jgi:hypothetical protein